MSNSPKGCASRCRPWDYAYANSEQNLLANQRFNFESNWNLNIYHVLGGEADLELKAMLYTSVVTICLVCFLHCFEPAQCRSTRHLNEYRNHSSMTRRCLRSCFLVRKISILICKLKHFGLSDSGICMDRCKYRGGSVLCNEMFSQTLSCRDLFVAARCDQVSFSCHAKYT